jgi:hypothetical protein
MRKRYGTSSRSQTGSKSATARWIAAADTGSRCTAASSSRSSRQQHVEELASIFAERFAPEVARGHDR